MANPEVLNNFLIKTVEISDHHNRVEHLINSDLQMDQPEIFNLHPEQADRINNIRIAGQGEYTNNLHQDPAARLMEVSRHLHQEEVLVSRRREELDFLHQALLHQEEAVLLHPEVAPRLRQAA